MFAFKISLVLGAIYSLYKTLETVTNKPIWW